MNGLLGVTEDVPKGLEATGKLSGLAATGNEFEVLDRFVPELVKPLPAFHIGMVLALSNEDDGNALEFDQVLVCDVGNDGTDGAGKDGADDVGNDGVELFGKPIELFHPFVDTCVLGQELKEFVPAKVF